MPDNNLAPKLSVDITSANIVFGESLTLKAIADDDGMPLPTSLTVNWEVISGEGVTIASLDARKIIRDLEVLLGDEITAGKDLLFFDEIQNCPRAIMSMRYFYEQIPGLHVIAAGSLLEFALEEISFPVGRV